MRDLQTLVLVLALSVVTVAVGAGLLVYSYVVARLGNAALTQVVYVAGLWWLIAGPLYCLALVRWLRKEGK